jgi:hypothetical protein
VWFLGLNAVAGPAQAIDHTAQFQKGGSIAAIASLQTGGGRDVEAQLVVVTTRGEMAVWAGANPERADGIRLVGVYNIPIPTGKRCFAMSGNRLLMATDRGLYSVPDIIGQRGAAQELSSVSRPIDRIRGTVSQIVESPSEQVTIAHAGAVQHVLSDTGAWSRFTGFASAMCWAEHDGQLVFGTSGGQVRRYTGALDGAAAIRAFAVDAHTRLGASVPKHLKRVRLDYTGADYFVPRVEVLADQRGLPEAFEARNLHDQYWYWRDPNGPQLAAHELGRWAQTPTPWVRPLVSDVRHWRSVSGRGVTIALMKAVWTKAPLVWAGYDLLYHLGNGDR